MIKNKELHTSLVAAADILRSKMDTSEYKNYLLGIIFYKYLSDTQINNECSYSYAAIVQKIKSDSFHVDDLSNAFKAIEQSNEAYANLFQDIDLYSKKLGITPQKQNETIAGIIKALSEIDFANYSGDVLGDAYEYLIGQFASNAGRAGEFYTPQPVAKLMTKIVMYGKKNKKGFSIYDATMGSGSLMLNVKNEANESNTVIYAGNELNSTTFNLARMNLILHGVSTSNQKLSNADTLGNDIEVNNSVYDAVLMNPPYSANWSAEKGFLTDPRFASYGILAPKSKADFAFLLHGFYHLKANGVMAIVLPHGVLFRGAAEGKIRQMLLENGHIYAVIGLPANLFFNTSIPTTIIVLRKDHDSRDVLFIDAQEKYEKVKTQNKLTDDHINEIFNAYIERKTIDKFSYLASYEEIVENEFNLNISRYVDTFEPEPEISLIELAQSMQETDRVLKTAETDLFAMLDDLKGTDSESEKEFAEFKVMLRQL